MIYLAGGIRTNWQDRVIKEVREAAPAILTDPRDERCGIEGVRRADIVFAYLESSNPSFAGLVFEIGFAAALSEALPAQRKQILLVCDPSHPYGRYLGMARICSDSVLNDLDAGIESLNESLPGSLPELARGFISAPPRNRGVSHYEVSTTASVGVCSSMTAMGAAFDIPSKSSSALLTSLPVILLITLLARSVDPTL